MSPTPPVPDAAVIPFPAPEPAPAADAAGDDRKRLIAGAAVGIGSAAIVAALLYHNRRPATPAKVVPQDDRRTD